MQSLSFRATFGNEIKSVYISNVHNDGSYYHLLINNYFQGSLYSHDGIWNLHSSNPTELTFEDLQFLGKKIDAR
jgi:hypothetical protein